MSYVDLVMCETATGKVELYQAPNTSLIKPEDLVVPADGDEGFTLKVKNVIGLSNKSDEYKFILELFGLKKNPPKLEGKFTYQKFEYRDGDADDQG